MAAAQGVHAVTVFEAAYYLGGHSHIVDLMLDGARAAVDTGFLVYSDRTYPRLATLFAELGIATAASEMSFSARIDGAGIEWSGTNLRALFAQPRNALSADSWRMLRDIIRFNREATALAARDAVPGIALGDHLDRERNPAPFAVSTRSWRDELALTRTARITYNCGPLAS